MAREHKIVSMVDFARPHQLAEDAGLRTIVLVIDRGHACGRLDSRQFNARILDARRRGAVVKTTYYSATRTSYQST